MLFRSGVSTWVRQVILLGAGASGAAALAVYVAMAVVHLDDNYHVDHVTGAWMGLAAYADSGVLYPPLFQDGFYAGTRYGPLGIVGNTAAAKLTGEYLVSGKVVALLLMVALLVLVYRICRRSAAPVAVSLAAAGTVVASFVTFFAGTTIYGDLLSTLLQLAAVAVVLRRGDTTSAAAAAGVLAALAITAKFSGLWGGAAVLIWLALHHRRLLVPFLAAGVTTAVAVFALATVASDGRMQDNLLGLGGSGFEGVRALVTQTPTKAVEALLSQAVGTALLLPLAVLMLLLALRRRRLELLELALLLCGLLSLVVLTDVGTGFNHLLDLAVLVPLVIATGYSRWQLPAPRLALAAVAVIPLATAVSLYDLRHDVRETAAAALDGRTVERWQTAPLSDRLGGSYFTEDPMVAVQNGDRPVALDSFMLLRLARKHPEWEQQLIDRFDQREFDTVVLIADLDLTDDWWKTSHLGLPIAQAIDRNYVLQDKVPGPTFAYRVLKPKP